MDTRRYISESRTTILYMVFFGIFILVSYFIAVDPVKKQHEQAVYEIQLGQAHDASGIGSE